MDKRTIEKIADILSNLQYGKVEITKEGGKIISVKKTESIKV